MTEDESPTFMIENLKPRSNRGRSPLRKANEIDLKVGQRLRLRRQMLHLSQEQLATKVGLTHQQVQKYETGATRLSASRLVQVSHVLDVPVKWFFEGVSDETSGSKLADGAAVMPIESLPVDSAQAVKVQREDAAELMTLFFEITDPRMRKKLLEVARILAD
jgi:transcriptional regulator with XRE-family HTH domain